MLYSTDCILTTHAGSLPRPADLREIVAARANGAPYDAEALAARLKSAVADVVRQQVECGLDCINDGELSKTNFTDYVRWRITGYVERPSSGPRRLSITARDETKFADYFQTNPRARPVGPPTTPVCVQKMRYTGQAEVAADIANLKSAIAGVPVAQAFLSANTPGTIEHWLANEYYQSDEEFVYAIADVMHEEYQAIVDGGFSVADRRPGLTRRLELPAQDYAPGIPPICGNDGRCAEPRAVRHTEGKSPAACLLGQPS